MGRRIRSIYKLISRIAEKLAVVEEMLEIVLYRLRIGIGSQEDRENLIAARCCAGDYRRKIRRLHCIALYLRFKRRCAILRLQYSPI